MVSRDRDEAYGSVVKVINGFMMISAVKLDARLRGNDGQHTLMPNEIVLYR